LLELPSLYRHCEQALPVASHNSTKERVSGTRSIDIPISEAAAEARSRIRGVLASWAALVVDERSISVAPQRAVPELVRFLTAHAHWLAAHPVAGDFAEEIGDLVTTAQRAVESEPTPQPSLGACIEAECAGRLTAHVRDQTGRGPAEIRCDAGHSWRADQWLLLSRRMSQVVHS
jgi:hypothetical protein